MGIFKKNKKERKVKENEIVRCDDVYVLTTEVVSNYNDGSDSGPQFVTLYYLGTKKEDQYYELFSGRKLRKEEDSKSECCVCKAFNKQYITKVEPLKEYLNNKERETIGLELLFDFITDMNVTEIVSQRSSDAQDDEE